MSARLKIGVGLAIFVLILILSFIGPALNRIPDVGIQTGDRELLVRAWNELLTHKKANGSFPGEFRLEGHSGVRANRNLEYFNPPNMVWGEGNVLVAAPPISRGSKEIRLVLKMDGVIKKVVKKNDG